MSNETHDVIISGVHLDLTEALTSIVREKVEKLFRHEHDIIRLRVELEYQSNQSRDREFIAKGHIEIRGNDMVVSVATENLYKSIDQLVIKLDRKLRRRARLKNVKRKQPHAVDVPADLPKVMAV